MGWQGDRAEAYGIPLPMPGTRDPVHLHKSSLLAEFPLPCCVSPATPASVAFYTHTDAHAHTCMHLHTYTYMNVHR